MAMTAAELKILTHGLKCPKCGSGIDISRWSTTIWGITCSRARLDLDYDELTPAEIQELADEGSHTCDYVGAHGSTPEEAIAKHPAPANTPKIAHPQ